MVDLRKPHYLRPSETEDNTYNSSPRYFKRRKNEIEAIRVDEENVKTVAKWCGGEAIRFESNGYIRAEHKAALRVPQLGEPLTVWLGEWLIKDEDGRYSVMDNKEFTTEFEFDKDRQNSGLPHDHIPGARSVET